MSELFTGTTNSGLVIKEGIVTSGKDCAGEIRVPEGTIGIADQAFYQNKLLTGLHLPEGLTAIGKYAVSGCINLNYIQVPESLSKLGENALVKRFESIVGFTHTMDSKEYYPEIRCKEGSWGDLQLQHLKASAVKSGASSTERIIELKYI